MPVLTTDGSSGGGDVGAWVAGSMDITLGLGALVLPHGEEDKIVALVKQIHRQFLPDHLTPEDGRRLLPTAKSVLIMANKDIMIFPHGASMPIPFGRFTAWL